MKEKQGVRLIQTFNLAAFCAFQNSPKLNVYLKPTSHSYMRIYGYSKSYNLKNFYAKSKL
jgi:hypothetical protein